MLPPPIAARAFYLRCAACNLLRDSALSDEDEELLLAIDSVKVPRVLRRISFANVVQASGSGGLAGQHAHHLRPANTPWWRSSPCMLCNALGYLVCACCPRVTCSLVLTSLN